MNTNTDDLISVAFSAYNHERYVEETIRSIMAQTYQNIELLVIDDGSADGTFAKMTALKPECEKRFARVVFETQENKGTCVNQNKIIDIAKGKYLYWTASDDMLKPMAIEVLHSFLSENPDYVLVVGDNEIINGKSERIYWGKNRTALPENEALYKTFGDELHLNAPDNKHADFGAYANLLKGNHIPNGFLVRRQNLIAAGKYKTDVILEDWYMNLQLAKQGKFKYIPEILYSYRWHEKNTVSSAAYNAKQSEIYRRIYEHEKEYCFTHGYKKQWMRQWCKRFGWQAKWKKLRDFIRGKK